MCASCRSTPLNHPSYALTRNDNHTSVSTTIIDNIETDVTIICIARSVAHQTRASSTIIGVLSQLT
jgi:hypothetical protein